MEALFWFNVHLSSKGRGFRACFLSSSSLCNVLCRIMLCSTLNDAALPDVESKQTPESLSHCGLFWSSLMGKLYWCGVHLMGPLYWYGVHLSSTGRGL